MAFTRTISGLNNQHIFFNVDIIVYVEGGVSYSLSQIEQGFFNEESVDSLFWNQIFTNFSTHKVKFKPIGSKSAILKIAQK